MALLLKKAYKNTLMVSWSGFLDKEAKSLYSHKGILTDCLSWRDFLFGAERVSSIARLHIFTILCCCEEKFMMAVMMIIMMMLAL